VGSNSIKYERAFKPSCPFGRRCHSDGSVCGFIGYYSECPQRLDKGSTSHDGSKAVKKNYYNKRQGHVKRTLRTQEFTPFGLEKKQISVRLCE